MAKTMTIVEVDECLEKAEDAAYLAGEISTSIRKSSGMMITEDEAVDRARKMLNASRALADAAVSLLAHHALQKQRRETNDLLKQVDAERAK